MSLVWAIYDITDDKVRRRIIKLCKTYGLYRVQKSVFLGKMDSHLVDEFSLQSEECINLEFDSVYIFPLCEQDFKKVKLIGQAFDKNLVSDKLLQLFV